jgi:hypothetical protein
LSPPPNIERKFCWPEASRSALQYFAAFFWFCCDGWSAPRAAAGSARAATAASV